MAWQGQRTTLELNIAPVLFDMEAVLEVGELPYQDKQQLQYLRDHHHDTHFFKRRSNKILAISLGDVPVLGEKIQRIRAGDDLGLVTSLVSFSLERYFIGQNRTLLDFAPLKVLSRRPEESLLWIAASQVGELPSWLGIRVAYSFDTRLLNFHPTRGQRNVVLACDITVHNSIDATCEQLLEFNTPLAGKYVTRLESRGAILTPRRRLVGRVQAVQGDVLLLDDHEEGVDRIVAKDAYLEPRQENIQLCIESFFGSAAAEVLDRLNQALVTLRSGPERLKRIRAALAFFETHPLEFVPNLSFTVGPPFSQQPSGSRFPHFSKVGKPLLVFDPSGTRTDHWNERGLDKHGPYDRRVFTPKLPRIVIICQRSEQGRVERFVHKLLEGMPNFKTMISGGQRAPYGQGFTRRFSLDDVVVKTFAAADGTVRAYADACRKAISYSSERNERWNLAIVQIQKNFRHFSPSQDPYWVAKSMLLKHQIPVQEVALENMRVSDSQLVHILNNISLAIYAKMGGVPWLLKGNPTIAHELVFGLGSGQVGESRLGPRERVVGITTVFTGDGNYLLANNSESVPYEGYPEALLTSLRETVNMVREEQVWSKGASVRLIFHTFKPLKDAEVAAVKAVMSDLGDFDAEYAFIHFVDDHPYSLFDLNNQLGVRGQGGKHRGVYAADRGILIPLGKHEILLTFKGPRELKRWEDGLPKPALLRLHQDSTFNDLTYLAEQAFNFSCHTWRSFLPAPSPITILYSELIAKLLRGLHEVPGWDPEAMLGRIGRMRWFL